MNKIGHDITQAELDTIMNQHDQKKDGVISFNEFKAIFLDIEDKIDEENYEDNWIYFKHFKLILNV